jgi:hypothetical protein
MLEERAKAQGITVEEATRRMAAGNTINHIVDAKEVAYVITFLAVTGHGVSGVIRTSQRAFFG